MLTPLTDFYVVLPNVSLLGIKDTGILAVAALMEQPNISEVVTLWSAFSGGVTKFEREGSNWLREYQDHLTPPLLGKITTIYTKNGFSNFKDTLQGAKIAKVTYKDRKVRTWRNGLDRLLSQPVNVYFSTRQKGN